MTPLALADGPPGHASPCSVPHPGSLPPRPFGAQPPGRLCRPYLFLSSACDLLLFHVRAGCWRGMVASASKARRPTPRPADLVLYPSPPTESTHWGSNCGDAPISSQRGRFLDGAPRLRDRKLYLTASFGAVASLSRQPPASGRGNRAWSSRDPCHARTGGCWAQSLCPAVSRLG